MKLIPRPLPGEEPTNRELAIWLRYLADDLQYLLNGRLTVEDQFEDGKLLAQLLDTAATTTVGADGSVTVADDTSAVRLSPSAAYTVYGFTSTFSDRRLLVVNVGSFDVTIAHQSVSATASDRVITHDGVDLVMEPNRAAILWHDSITDRWRVVATTVIPAAGGGGSGSFNDTPPAADRWYRATGNTAGAHNWATWGLPSSIGAAGTVLASPSSGVNATFRALTATDIPALGSANIIDGAIITSKLADLAVTLQKVADQAITTAKLADAAVTAGKLAASAVGETHLQNLAVTAAKVADSAITTQKIADAAIAAGKIAANVLVGGQNLLGPGGHDELSSSGSDLYYAGSSGALGDPLAESLDAFGLAVGDLISASADVRVGTATGAYLRITFRNIADAVISTHTSSTTSSASYVRLKVEEITVPANTTQMSVHVGVTASGTFWTRRGMVNRGYRALEYEYPPLRLARETLADINGRLATSQMLVQGHNLLENGGFELGDVGWTKGVGFTIESDPANARTGDYVCRYQGDGVGGPNLFNNAFVKVEAGEQLYAAVWARTPAGAGTSSLRVRWFEADQATLISVSSVASVAAGGAATWTKLEGIATAPTGAVYGRFDFGENSADNSTTPWYVDDCVMLRAISTDLLVAGAVTADKISANAVTADKIAANAVTTAKLDALAVTTEKLAAGAVTAAKITAGQIQASHIAAGAVTTAALDALAVTTDKLAANAVTAAKIAAGTITSTQIAANTITAANIAANAIQASEIDAGAVTTAKLAALAVTADKIATNAVESDKILANAITAGHIAAGAVSAVAIAAGSIYARHLVVGGMGQAMNDDPTLSDLSAWDTAVSANWSIVNVTSGSAVGSTAFQVVNPSTSTAYSIFSSKRFPIDNDRTYRVSVWARQPSGTGTNYLSVAFYDANNNHITGSGSGSPGWLSLGTYHYWGVSNSQFPTSFTRYEFTFGPGGSGSIPSNAVSCRIGCLVARGSATTVQFQDFRLEEALPSTLIVNGAITADKVAANAITAAKIVAGTITANEIANSTITGGKIAGSTITAANIASSTITATQIANSTITGGKIAGTTITGSNMVNGTITATQIADATITGAKIANSTITGGKIAGTTITASNIVDSTITGAKIANATITSGKISVSSLSSLTANIGTITAGLLNNAASSPTAGIRLDSGSTKPGTWTAYLDLAATTTNPFLQHPALSLLANGSATFSGTVAASTFTSSAAYFQGDVVMAGGALPQTNKLVCDWDGLRFTILDATDASILYSYGTAGVLTITSDDVDIVGNTDITGTLTVSGTLDSNGTLRADGGMIIFGNSVSVGANDSAGTGYRVLRIPNTPS